ncbi:MAG: hypothetical protein K2N63_02080 [Lachnospiraceae bacterium]|nr:hypothetical protein [Lachnospiraceae bacterium]
MRAGVKNTQTAAINPPGSLGVREDGGYCEFAVFLPGTSTCGLRIYDLEKGEATENLSLFALEGMPGVFGVRLKREGLPECFGYRYVVEGKEFLDPYAKHTVGREVFGVPGECYGTVDEEMAYRYYMKRDGRRIAPYRPFSFENDRPPRLAYQDMILYKLHVRGFSMTAPGVRHKGTYRGLLEKKPYLLELGVNALLLLPCVEFDEILSGKEAYGGLPAYARPLQHPKISGTKKDVEILYAPGIKDGAGCRVNYWGFAKESSYFAPKVSYASKPYLAASEFKQMVAGMHESGIEVLLEMNFQPTDNPNLIHDCLVWWVQEYHIDGFRYNTDLYPARMAALCPELAGVKILSTGFGDIGEIHRVSGFGAECAMQGMPSTYHTKNFGAQNSAQEYKPVLAEYNEGFLREIRRFVKGDEEMVGAVAARIERQSGSVGIVNYIADHNGFTLADVYSYDIKHNETNGEENRDGTDYNFSWNCGVEGLTKKKKILKLRSQMRKNALILLFTSMGTPMLLAGDEFGNTQGGNNNAYCQDNETGWVSWRELRANKDQFEFVKQLIALRRAHPILRSKVPLRGMDYISCGCPDVSRHGTRAWYPDYSNYSRTLAMLFCGKYAMANDKASDQSIYIAANMHWEPHVFDLPDLCDGEELTFLLCSDADCTKKEESEVKKGDGARKRTFEVPPRSIALFIGKKKGAALKTGNSEMAERESEKS